MRMKKIGIVTCLLFLCLTLGHGTTIHAAQAEEPAKTAASSKSLTGLALTGLEAPDPGVPFDTFATIVTAEGVSWEIPVVWVDEHGNRVTVPVRGKKYYPAFIFYVPDGYKVANVDAAGAFALKLPDFVVELIGPEGLVFAVDPANGITYAFPVDGTPAEIKSLLPESVRAALTKPEPVPEAEPEQTTRRESSPEPEPEKEEPAAPAEESPAPEPYVSARVRMYCGSSAINTLGNEFLEWFIDLVKDTLVPQATSLLREKFPNSIGEAAPGTELSSDIGLYIYHGTGEILGCPTPSDAVAFVAAIADPNVLENILGLDTSSFTAYDTATGKWIITEDGKTNLDNTIVHELLHAFMYDYARYGMFATQDATQRYPQWFIEGLSSAVENNYWYRTISFFQLAGNEVFDVLNSETGVVNPQYTEANVLSGYLDPYLVSRVEPEYASNYNMDMTVDGMASYTSGYLAVVYLGYLDALSRNLTPIDGNNNINMDVIRSGVDDVLKRLHGEGGVGVQSTNAQSLDDIIYDISEHRYSSTDDFTAKFIKGTADAQGTYSGDVTASGTGSLNFTSQYLTWLSAQRDITQGNASNGSILFQDQDFMTPLNWDWEGSSPVYQILDTGGLAVSSVDKTRANQTGGKGSVGNGSQSYTEESGEKNEEEELPEQLAAKTQNGLTQTPAGEVVDTQEAEAEDAAVEQKAEEPTAADPVLDPAPAAQSETDTDAADPAADQTPAVQPGTEPAADPAPAVQPGVEPAAEPAPAVQPETEPASEPESESEPAAEPTPALEPETAPATDEAAEPAADPAAEEASEPESPAEPDPEAPAAEA